MKKTKKSSGERAVRILGYVLMILAVTVALYPILWVILSSFKTNKEILSSGLSLPEHFSLDGYKQALEMAPIFRFFGTSLFVSVIATVLNVLFLSMSGYIFAKKRFRGKNVLFWILSLSMVIPTTALLSPVFTVISRLGLYDTRTALIIVYIALSMPVSLMILRSTFASIPDELEEAAKMDGAGFLKNFFLVMVPCAKGGMASAAVLAFLESWNEFTFALILTSSVSTRTLPLSLSYFTAQFSFNYTALFAAITIAVIPSIVIFAVFQEQVNQSLVAGSVKG